MRRTKIALLAIPLLIGACSELSAANKTACETQADCLGGYTCVDRVCTVAHADAGTPDTGPPDSGSGGAPAHPGSGGAGHDGGAPGPGTDASHGGANAGSGGDSGHPPGTEAGTGPETGAEAGHDGGPETGAPPPVCSPVFVNEASAAPSPSGASWGTAHRDLQAAIADAASRIGLKSCSRVEVWVAAGLYTPGPAGARGVSFTLKDGVEIYGGFAGTETARGGRDVAVNPTILSGDLLRDDALGGGSSAENAYHVVRADLTTDRAILDGFVVEAGHADGGFPDHLGAGLYLTNSDARLENLAIRRTIASQDGGALYLHQGRPSLRHVTISLAQALARGGGIFAHKSSVTLTDVTIENGQASGGGAGLFAEDSALVVADSTFRNNLATGAGGAIYALGGRADLRATNFDGNQAASSSAAQGGAIYESGTELIVDGCRFTTNQTYGASASGGAIFALGGSTARLVRSVFYDNRASGLLPNAGTSAPGYGGALYVEDGSLSVTSTEFSGNRASGAGSVLGAVAQGGAVYLSSGTARLANAVFQGNQLFGSGPESGAPSVYVLAGAAQITNATFLDASAGTCAGCDAASVHGPVTLTNSVIWRAGASAFTGGVQINFSCIENGGYDEANPAETNRDDCTSSSLGLLAGSPGIDQGDPAALPADAEDLDGDGDVLEPLSVDFTGAPRVAGTSVDMGAYETQPVVAGPDL